MYLKDPLTEKEISGLLKKLNISARDLLRKNEEAYKINGLSDKSISVPAKQTEIENKVIIRIIMIY